MAWPFDSEAQLDEWVDAYIVAHLRRPDSKEQEEASYLASEPGHLAFLHGHAEAMWQFILKVVAKRPSEWTLCMLAAGPIEDLIGECGDAFIDRIEVEARRDPVFRRALHGVWKTTSRQDVWNRIVEARGPEQEP